VQADQVGDVLIILDHEDAFGLFHPAQSFGAMSALCENHAVAAGLLAMEYQSTPRYLTQHRQQAGSYIELPRHCAGFSAPELSRIV
jgi:hypothetical protein